MAVLNVIRCDLPQSDYLVWKWTPQNGTAGRENQIRWGSSLRVRAGETAAFFYSRGGGTPAIDIIDGPSDLILETKNFPVISSIVGLVYGGGSPFQAELFFINKGQATQLRWGIPWFDAFDPRFEDFPVPVALSGAITFNIEDVRKFIEIQRLDSFDPALLAKQIRPQLASAIKANVVTLAVARGIPLVQIGGRTDEIATALMPTIVKVLDQFGLSVRNFAIEGIELNKESEGFKDLVAVTKKLQMTRMQTQSEVEVRNMTEGQDINLENLRESLEIQRSVQSTAGMLQAQTQYIGAHQINLQADVAKTAAQSMGTMGSGGGGGGGGGDGLVGLGAAAMMMGVGLPVGTAMGQHLAANVSGVMGTAAARPPVPQAVPPPVSPPAGLQLHVMQNGQSLGILAIDEVNRRLAAGTLSRTDIGWHAGIPAWEPLHSIQGVTLPPPPPPSPGLQLHVMQNGQALGILSVDEVNRRLAVGTLSPTDIGWYPGLPAWQPLHSMQGVCVAPPPPPPPPQ
jgi:membrane protease subunit (stomatin/prohibitin family)